LVLHPCTHSLKFGLNRQDTIRRAPLVETGAMAQSGTHAVRRRPLPTARDLSPAKNRSSR